MAAAKSEHALWAGNPTVIICLLGFLDLFGVSMIMPLIQSHAKELGASPSVAGLIGSIYGFLQLFSSPIVGKWSDLVGHRIVLLICLMATGGGYILLGLSSSLLLLALSRIPSGLFKHTQTISKAYLAEVIPPEQRATVYGQFNAVSSVGFIIGPTVGGHLAESTSSGFVFVGLLAGLVFFTSAVIVRYCLPIPEKSTSPQRDPVAQQSTVTDIFRNINVFKAFAQVNWAKVWDLFLVNFLLGFGAIMFRSNFTRMLIETFQTSPKINGYVISVGGILSTLFSFIVGHIAKYYDDDTKLFLHSSVLNVLGLIGLFFAPNVIWFVLLQSPSILASSVNRVIAVNLTVEKGGKSEVGGLMGLNQSLLAMSRTLAPLLAGVLMEFHSMGPVLGSCVVSSVAIGAMCLLPGWKSKPSTKKD